MPTKAAIKDIYDTVEGVDEVAHALKTQLHQAAKSKNAEASLIMICFAAADWIKGETEFLKTQLDSEILNGSKR
jgi:hypothetical protein